MTVIAFQPRPRETVPQQGPWSLAELDSLAEILKPRRRGYDWDAGMTEQGDAQYYVLGPQPERACEICVSRIDGRYILEDGAGHLLFEHRSLSLVAMHARVALRNTRWWLVARIVMVWCTIRHMIHDRIEPLMAEGEDLLVHFVPQLATLV